MDIIPIVSAGFRFINGLWFLFQALAGARIRKKPIALTVEIYGRSRKIKDSVGQILAAIAVPEIKRAVETDRAGARDRYHSGAPMP